MAPPHLRCVPAVGLVAYSDDVGGSLRWWRDLHDVSQTNLADQMGVSPSVLSDYEGGRRENPGIDFIADYVSGVVRLVDRDVVEQDATNYGSPPYSLGGENEEWGSVPGNVPDNIRQTVESVWEGFDQS